ncbi:hypothetical protein BLNAU_17280 [Blattamonas nauphoetae]|uniref:Uncharacterized protein n=1 Tax=Blattamonas nauphoetae TaxID=2049346 RepID=A0ABQ9X7F2_9EUKA|nr:hypothetical protein BLNAU_17280 [Blattamonas nauphoetae]
MQSVRHLIPTFNSCFDSLHSHSLFFSPHPHPRHSAETLVFLSHLTHTQLFTTLADTLRQSAVEMIFVSRHLVPHDQPFLHPFSSRSHLICRCSHQVFICFLHLEALVLFFAIHSRNVHSSFFHGSMML